MYSVIKYATFMNEKKKQYIDTKFINLCGIVN